MRVCRPFLPGDGLGTGGKDATGAAPCVRRAARPPRAFRSDAPKLMPPDQRQHLPFQANLLCFRAFS
jgi:hypothetical protein